MSTRAPDELRERVKDYYQEFSLAVGLRDWLSPNARHEQLKLIVDRELRPRATGRILDVGCGTGVMSDHIRRHGEVTGVDLSEPAVRLGNRLGRGVRLTSAPIHQLPSDPPYDAITLFDVLEHVPIADRGDFFAQLDRLLGPAGVVFASTPHPSYIRWVREHEPSALQVVDEEVEPADVIALAAEHGLELAAYDTYEIEAGRQYQAFTLERRRAAGGPSRPRTALRLRLALRANPVARASRRVRLALRLARAGGLRAVPWVLRGGVGEPPDAVRRSLLDDES